jgi:hypothetical protein
MTRKQRKEAAKVANYIINNITMSEIIHLVAQRANESAEKIVRENLNASEYKEIMLKKEKKEKSFFTKVKDWIKGEPKVKSTPPPKTETETEKPKIPTKKAPRKRSKRASLATRKVKKG